MILGLIAIHRDGMRMSGWQFLQAGMLMMPTSLVLAIGAVLRVGGR